MANLQLETALAAYRAGKAWINEAASRRPEGAPRAAWLAEQPRPSIVASWPVTKDGKKLVALVNLDTFAALRILEDKDGARIVDNIDLRQPDAQKRLDEYELRPDPGAEIIIAKTRLGEMWGLSRALHNFELARALRLGGRDPGRSVQDWITGKTKVTGPVQVAIEMMLAGAMPPDPLDTIIGRRG